MTRSLEDIRQYEKDALEQIEASKMISVLDVNDKVWKLTNPHYDEIKQLLTDQINDELYDATHSITNRRAS